MSHPADCVPRGREYLPGGKGGRPWTAHPHEGLGGFMVARWTGTVAGRSTFRGLWLRHLALKTTRFIRLTSVWGLP